LENELLEQRNRQLERAMDMNERLYQQKEARLIAQMAELPTKVGENCYTQHLERKFPRTDELHKVKKFD
jgi:hypothetical protein